MHSALGDILVQAGVLTPKDLERAMDQAASAVPRKSLAACLDEGQAVEPGQLVQALDSFAQQHDYIFLPTIQTEQLRDELIQKIPVEWARQNLVVPVRMDNRTAMACTDPMQLEALEEMRMMTGEDVFPVIAAPQVIKAAIEQAFFQRTRSAESLAETMTMADANEEHYEDAVSQASDLLRESDQAPVTRLVNMVLLEALKKKASDVHIEPFQSTIRIRYRIDGVLHEQPAPPRHLYAGFVSRLKVMARLDIAEKRLPQDGTASVRIGQREIDIRVSTMPVAEGERVVLRLLHRSDSMLQLKALGLHDDILAEFGKLLELTQGVILITGPTGSGKTTTLYSALQELDRDHLNIMTIEDPIEYQLHGIGQIQVKPQIGLTFSSGLRHILRQDPDIVLVGETRDLETAEIMIRASLTGHLVFTTLHTNDAPSALVRLVDMGIEPYLLASSVKAVLAQRLVRRLCPHCRQPTMPDRSAHDLELLDPEMRDLLARKTLFEAGEGCASCYEGYSGRIGVYELFIVDRNVQEFVRRNRTSQALRDHAVSAGMRSLLVDGLLKVADGQTSLHEVLRICGDHGA